MDWQPISEASLWDLINTAEIRMNPTQARLWELVRFLPQKWNGKLNSNTNHSFWVVAIVGPSVIFYDDIEYGFGLTRYSTFGTIDGYRSGEAPLEQAVQDVLNNL